jgi:hypothetical protein
MRPWNLLHQSLAVGRVALQEPLSSRTLREPGVEVAGVSVGKCHRCLRSSNRLQDPRFFLMVWSVWSPYSYGILWAWEWAIQWEHDENMMKNRIWGTRISQFFLGDSVPFRCEELKIRLQEALKVGGLAVVAKVCRVCMLFLVKMTHTP